MTALTPATAKQLRQLRERLTSANVEVLIPKLEAEAKRRLRAADLPCTMAELLAVERFGHDGERLAFARITSDKRLSAQTRAAAEILWLADSLKRLTSGSDRAAVAARDTFAEAARFFTHVIASILADDAPLRSTGARTRARLREGNATKGVESADRATEMRIEYERVRAQNPKLSHAARCQKVAARLGRGGRRGFGASTVRRKLQDLRKK